MKLNRNEKSKKKKWAIWSYLGGRYFVSVGTRRVDGELEVRHCIKVEKARIFDRKKDAEEFFKTELLTTNASSTYRLVQVLVTEIVEVISATSVRPKTSLPHI